MATSNCDEFMPEQVNKEASPFRIGEMSNQGTKYDFSSMHESLPDVLREILNDFDSEGKDSVMTPKTSPPTKPTYQTTVLPQKPTPLQLATLSMIVCAEAAKPRKTLLEETMSKMQKIPVREGRSDRENREALNNAPKAQ